MSRALFSSIDLDAVYADLPDGHDAPTDDRNLVDEIAGGGASAYGEILPEGTRILLDWLKPGPTDEVVDLGSGAGRFVLQVALESTARRVTGIELSHHRHTASCRALDTVESRLPSPAAAQLRSRVFFEHGDLAEFTPGRATIAWAGSTCYPDALLSAMARTALRSQSLRYLLTTRPLPDSARIRFEDVGTLNLPTTWLVKTPVHVLRPRR